MIDISTVANNAAFMYTLLLIAVLLTYIAFYKKSPTKKSTRK